MLERRGSHVIDERDSGDSIVAPGGRLIWVLIHPSEAPDGPGIFLFDEEQQQVPCPTTVRSPPV
jgi:hypothetical protein